ncbi:MAG: TonB-dependent receptor, partial [Alphaproteobacteria bacterium]|nr:TonB-dependent receptor [Alphaproteobacteria bacterium]
ATFCDPSIVVPNYGSCTPDQSNFYDVTLNTGTTMPVWNPADPTSAPSTYHNWSGADRFNFAPLNLLLTPSQRKALWGSVSYDISDDVQLYAKGMFNNRESANQAAPEPIFVGPYAGTGGIADTISISHLNPYNPYGIDLCAVASPTCGTGVANLGWITRRPIEAGPRIFTQDVDTWYFSTGLRGTIHVMEGFTWDVNFVDTDNKARQKFTGGYNLGNLSIALGDPAICALVPNCVPLDLFGGQGRPITPAMLKYVEATQIDQSDQKLKLISANITGTIFHIEDRAAGVAIGAEHRHYDGSFDPDPLRQEGLSQDSLAFPVAASYRVNEVYGELSLPLLKSLGASAAVRYSDYSTFGTTTTYKGGLRWQPVDDFGLRGTYSTGFRAPNLGELYGLTQFGATLVDPCGPTGGGIAPQYAAGCAAQHIPPNFQQANTQITTFTGGNPDLKPEKSDSYTAGFVYRAGWAEGRGGTSRLNLEGSYYHHKVKGAIQAEDIQALLNACLSTGGGTDPLLCGPFSRGAGSQLNPPKNFLQNLANITTSGVDLKLTWLSEPLSFGHLSAAVQATRVINYEAVDTLGLVAQRTVGIEVADSSIPSWRANAQLDWGIAGFDVNWNLRFLSAVRELCGNAATTIAVPGCADANGKFSASTYHNLHSVLYHDIQVSWTDAFRLTGLKVDLGVNNVFGSNPPVCYTCTLNGYDAGTYDLPGAFWNVRATYKF